MTNLQENGKQASVLGLRIESGLLAHNLISQSKNIRDSLKAAQVSDLSETLAQNLVTGIFVHVKKDPAIISEYLPLIKKLVSVHTKLRLVLEMRPREVLLH